mmetsp:Transcript_12562/g.22474  ORF Transcript_12562/g.22474 Transcript_12562/m.22474 type:complete len:132 (-) Transcript_12562:124-519(-)
MGWLPDHVWAAQKKGGRKGGSKGGSSWKKPSGGGGGGKKWSKSYLWKAKGDCKVWIGGLPDNGKIDKDMNKALLEHMKQGGDCKYAEIKKGGVGGAIYKTAEEAAQAVMALSGSMFEGHYIQLDVWEKKVK